jgi:serine/threonine protein kinase
VYIILEMMRGGELLYAVADRGYLPEEDAREIMKTVFEGLYHMHSRNVAHRDLKLENLLVVDPNCICKIKIADFGLSKLLKDNTHMATVCGTPMYVSPEALCVLDEQETREGYGLECDMWACGVILYILLGGHPPFTDKHGGTDGGNALFRKIREGGYTFNDPVWGLVTDGAKNLIMQLLTIDPHARISARDALIHPWIKNAKYERSCSMP